MKKQNWFKKHEKAAVAGFCAAVLGVTGITAYQLQSVHAETFSLREGGRDSWDQVTRKERQEMSERIQKKVRELEKYDVTYDSEKDAIYYDGRKVRWLVDKLRDGTDTEDYICCVDGDIILYTERNADGVLTGVRVGFRDGYGDDYSFRSKSSDDYSYRSKDDEFLFDFDNGDAEEWEEETEYLKEEYGDVFMFSVATDTDMVTVLEQDDGDFDITAEAAETAVVAGEAVASDKYSRAIEEAVGKAVEESIAKGTRAAEAFAEENCYGNAYMDEDNVLYMDENNQLYESLGLKWDKGYWTYHDKKVKIIWVEDGGFTSYGNVSDGIYLYIRKDGGDGKASFQVEELTRAEMQELYQQNHPGSSIP